MQEAIIVSFRWTAQEMVLIQRLHIRYSSEGRVLRGFYIAAIVIFSVLAIGSLWKLPVFMFTLPFSIILIFLFFVPLFMRRTALKAYAKKPDKDMVITYEITADRLTSKTEIATSEMLWRTIIRAQRVREGLFLYVSDRSVHWLPVRGFQDPADVERLAQITQKNVAEYESSV